MIRSNRRYSARLAPLLLLWGCADTPSEPGSVAPGAEEIRSTLFQVEAESHQQWLNGNVAALDELMAEEYHFVVMNGAVETKADVVIAPYTGAGPLRVQSLRVEPETLALRGNVAIVISLLHLDATALGQPLPPRMRILSIFTQNEGQLGWKLTARSITPILAPPGGGSQ